MRKSFTMSDYSLRTDLGPTPYFPLYDRNYITAIALLDYPVINKKLPQGDKSLL